MEYIIKDLENQNYTDVELTLIDLDTEISIKAHKVVLGCNCPYFHSLFNFGEKKDKYTMQVDDVEIMHSIILSFYGKQNYENHDVKYILTQIKCRNYLCLSNKIEWLYHIDFTNYYDLFIEIVELFDYKNDKILKRMIKKLPENYQLPNRLKLTLENKDFKIVSGNDDGVIKIWDLENGTLLDTLYGHDLSVSKIVISPDNSKIISCSFDGSIKIWNAIDNSLLHTLKHNDKVCSIAISTDNSKIVSRSCNNSIKVWDLKDGTMLNDIYDHKHSGHCIEIFHDNSKIIYSSYKNTIKVRNLITNEDYTLFGHEDVVHCLAISSDDSKIVSGSRDGTIRIWNSHNNKLLRILHNNSAIYSVTISSDNSTIISGSADNTVKIWNIEDESVAIFFILEGHTNSVCCVKICPFFQTPESNNSKIISTSKDGTIKIWDMKNGSLLRTLKDEYSVYALALLYN